MIKKEEAKEGLVVVLTEVYAGFLKEGEIHELEKVQPDGACWYVKYRENSQVYAPWLREMRKATPEEIEYYREHGPRCNVADMPKKGMDLIREAERRGYVKGCQVLLKDPFWGKSIGGAKNTKVVLQGTPYMKYEYVRCKTTEGDLITLYVDGDWIPQVGISSGKSLSSRPKPRFNVGDIVDTNDKGWQFIWDGVDNPNALNRLSSKLHIKKEGKVTDVIWSDRHKMWWYRVNDYLNAYTESALELHIPEKKRNTYASLIKEAKERGVWEVPIIDVDGDEEEHSVYGAHTPTNEDTSVLWSSYGKVYEDGKWATPLEKEITPDGIILKSFPQKRQITKEDQKEILKQLQTDYGKEQSVLPQHQTPVTFPKKKKGRRLQITDF